LPKTVKEFAMSFDEMWKKKNSDNAGKIIQGTDGSAMS